MEDIRTSLLVRQQVPQFIRDEYPKFISFVEAYYEFLETERFNVDGSSKKNDLSVKLKSLKTLSDVSQSLDIFEEQFFNVFTPLIPRDSYVDKEFLIKHSLELYQSKGSLKSFELFFRMLFGEDVKVKTPKDNILRASDGRWVVENVLRISPEIWTTYTGNGTKVEFPLSQVVDKEDIKVFINDVEQDPNTYYLKKEFKKLIFISAPASGADISVSYTAFDTTLILNRKITGVKSKATALVEKVDSKILGQETYLQLYFNKKTLVKDFRNGEYITCDFYDDNGTLIKVKLLTLSFVTEVNILKPGSGYKVGDPAIVVGPSSRQAKVIIDEVESGVVEDILIIDGGAGFKVSNNVRAIGLDETSFLGAVIAVDSSGAISPNTISFNTDIINAYSNLVLSNTNFGFPANGVENINSTIANSLSFQTITNVGPVTLINVITSFVTSAQIFNIESIYNGFNVADIGAIGKIHVTSPGTGYQIGDQVVFTNQPGEFSGRNAQAHVSGIDGLGGVEFVTVTNGGYGYYTLPDVSIQSANGVGASIHVDCIMGDGESLTGLLPVDEEGNQKFSGQIKSLRILDRGLGYDVLPFIDLTLAGNGDALAEIKITKSFDELPGRWITSDGMLSTEERRIQGRDYYVNSSYVLNSKLEFLKYKKALLDLIHPAGMNAFAECEIVQEVLPNTSLDVSTLTVKTVSGTVNTNSSVYVIGTNTKFIVSNTYGVLTPGKTISINNETRIVNTIISNTVLTVTNAFSYNASSQTLHILN